MTMKAYQKCIIVILTFQVVNKIVSYYTNEAKSAEEIRTNYEVSSQVLSRRKRFLLFPEGSSFQLVFCVQNSALIAIGDIFLFGSTLSLAWALPTDPKYLTMLKNKDIFGAQRMDIKNSKQAGRQVDSYGKSFGKQRQPMKKLSSIARRSAESQASLNRKKRPYRNIDKKRMHEKQLRREFLKTEYMNESSIRFHRSSRVGLYEKLETLFQAAGQDGRQCVLRKLCEAAQLRPRQATFLQEILHVVFKLPKEAVPQEYIPQEYDDAHRPNTDCSKLYPECGSMDILNTL